MKKLFMHYDDSLVRRGDSVQTKEGLGILKSALEPKKEGYVGLVVVEVSNALYTFDPKELGMEWREVDK